MILVWTLVPRLGASELQLTPRVIDGAISLQPTDLRTATFAGDVHLFVVSQPGQVWRIEGTTVEGSTVLPEPFLDIADRVAYGPEQGLLSMAIAPVDSAFGSRVYVTYTRAVDGASVLSRFLPDPDSPDRLAPSSEEILLVVPQPGPNHNVNQLRFGPDGYLYVAVGDGVLAAEPPCVAQQGDVLLGKILRLDVEVAVGYQVPDDNPFVRDDAVRDEVWALGFRNPWRLSFDRVTGDLFIADPGQQGPTAREEINVYPRDAPGGRNFGWKIMSGSACRGIEQGCTGPVPACGDPGYIAPAIEYLHDTPSRCAVIGGYVYRGTALPALVGAYIFGDFCGQLWIAWPQREGQNGGWRLEAVGPNLPGITTLGEDIDGELLIGTLDGRILRLVGAALTGDCVDDAETLCLRDGRFRVRATWQTSDRSGVGKPVPLDAAMDRSGGWFWFFRPGNPEVFVKVLDACTTPSRRFWIFAGGLTDVGVMLEVVDTATGATYRYSTEAGSPFGTLRDTRAFDTCSQPP